MRDLTSFLVKGLLLIVSVVRSWYECWHTRPRMLLIYGLASVFVALLTSCRATYLLKPVSLDSGFSYVMVFAAFVSTGVFTPLKGGRHNTHSLIALSLTLLLIQQLNGVIV